MDLKEVPCIIKELTDKEEIEIDAAFNCFYALGSETAELKDDLDKTRFMREKLKDELDGLWDLGKKLSENVRQPHKASLIDVDKILAEVEEKTKLLGKEIDEILTKEKKPMN